MTLPGRILVSVFILLAITSAALAQQLYIANEPKQELELLNLNTGAISVLYKLTADLDDLVLNSQGQLIYSIPSLGQVDLFDATTGTNSILATGLKYARDLEIEPGGQTMLIAIYSPGSIVRYNFSTGAQTTLIKHLGTCDGIKYDGYGNLYAVADHNTIIRIDPVAGTILQTLTLEPHSGVNGGDGMTYDTYTGELWTTHDGTTGYGVEEIFTNASGFTGAFTLYPTPTVHAPDGIKSDGKGNLYIGAIHTVAVYNIPTNTVTQNIVVDGADGVSLVPGTY
jgi:sugar lactone lactonase YvrE